MWRTLYVFDESRYLEALRIVAETPNVILHDSFWNVDLLGYKIEIECRSEQALKTLKIYISNTEMTKTVYKTPGKRLVLSRFKALKIRGWT